VVDGMDKGRIDTYFPKSYDNRQRHGNRFFDATTSRESTIIRIRRQPKDVGTMETERPDEKPSQRNPIGGSQAVTQKKKSH
jgi:hypothetical protein